MKSPKKKTRARSPEKKAEQFDKILEEGKDMFVKYGTHGFSTRALAQKLDMTQPNLYNYVSSKRELWIAIRIKYYNEYSEGLKKIINEHQGSYTELFYKFSEFFLEFAAADYKRFQLMYLISAPPSKKVGPLEKGYKPFQLPKLFLDLAKDAVKAGEIRSDTATELFYSMYAHLFGAAKVEADLKLRNKITEPPTGDFYRLTAKKYREYILKEIRDRLEKNILKD
ncbi:MAG: TetR/AcrR family transcriptional regulator [Promethearchaeota archaeon]